jgi:hypothetical protein
MASILLSALKLVHCPFFRTMQKSCMAYIKRGRLKQDTVQNKFRITTRTKTETKSVTKQKLSAPIFTYDASLDPWFWYPSDDMVWMLDMMLCEMVNSFMDMVVCSSTLTRSL